jgi:phage terminase small subunit
MSVNKTNFAKLTPKQRKAIEALITSGDITQAAQTAGVARDTLYRWMRQEDFQAALNAAEAEAIETLARKLVRLGEKAAHTLAEAMDSEDATTSAKVRAADIVISRLLQLREMVDLEKRVQELEKQVLDVQKA